MRALRSVWRRQARILAGLAAPVLLALNPYAQATDLSPLPAPAAAAPAVQVFDLHACREYAVAHQPAVAAARESLAAALTKQQALDRPRLGSAILAPDLPMRRKQAALGVAIAQAEVDAAECQARYSATYCYLAVLYALEQQKNISGFEKNRNDLKKLGEAALNPKTGEAGRRDVSKPLLDLIDAYIEAAGLHKPEAAEGYERALAALREALGMGPNCPLPIAGTSLPEIATIVDKDLIVQAAIARRAEVIETANAEQIYCLEVEAQGRLLLPSGRTFASGGDIHARTLPAPLYDPDYRPGAVAQEMPGTLVGSPDERKREAEVFHARSAAVAEKTRNLVVLEAEDSYHRWKQYDDEAPDMKRVADKLEKQLSDLSTTEFSFSNPSFPTLQDLLNAALKYQQVRVEATQVQFYRLAALANLERVTAGGFCPGLEGSAPASKP